jgi:C4-dicarboxylate transporter
MQEMPSEVTSNDKLWVLLGYIFSPLVPIIVLLMEDKKTRPFIRAHNAQALVLGILEIVLYVVLGWTIFLACVPFLLWIYMIYLGIQGYQGKYTTVPVVTNFVKNQGWA